MRAFLQTLVIVAALGACSPPAQQSDADTESSARAAHEAYVTAINSNDVDALMAMLTDDIVYLAPHEPALIGRAAVRPWIEGYFGAYQTNWVKTTDEFVVSGDWAIERYSYASTDTPRNGGAAISDTGKGINIYHHDADGTWRVARDAWNSDLPIAAP